MKSVNDFFRQGNMVPASLLASAFVAFITVMSFLVLPVAQTGVASMRIIPQTKTVLVDEVFSVDVLVESSVPVNVFAGELHFDTQTLAVESIAYNTSVANLWAEEPWYSNGEGTLNFIGGTTQKGGFTGSEKLITVTFKAKQIGGGSLAITDAAIMQHDGLGSDAPLHSPIDALFIVTAQTATTTTDENLLANHALGSSYQIVPIAPSTDLNGDGKQGIADASILLLNLGSKDPRFDFNLDGEINLKDLNILLGPS